MAAAIALWNTTGQARLAAGGDASAASIPIHFQFAASPDHGLYDGQRGVIFINDDLSGDPLAVTLAHELGHAFGLVHVDPGARSSVMNPGNLSTAPTAADAAQVAGLWGQCPPLDPTRAQ
jgi:predicted Zn-dependent protease